MKEQFASTKHQNGLNLAAYKFLAIVSMLYMSIMLCNAILTNRYIGTDTSFVLGGSFTSPFFFILGDIIAEIYGYKMAKSMIWMGFACQTIFIIICQIVLNAPHPSFFKDQAIYSFLLGPSLLRINLGGFLAYMVSNLLNAKIITKWKVLVKGKYFWLRSIGASTISEGLYSLIAILLMELNTIPMHDILKVIFLSYIIKLSYSIIFAVPASLLVAYVKRVTGVDVYDHSTAKISSHPIPIRG